MLSKSIVILVFGVVCQLVGQNEAKNRLETISDILGKPYDKIHEFVVDAQIENYHEPVHSIDTREHKSLNGLWDFCFDPNNEGHRNRWPEKPLSLACTERGNFYRMPVPSAFNEILSNRTAKNYMGWMWYQTSFTWPLFPNFMCYFEKKDSLMLQMESINYLALIWIQTDNGPSDLVGSHAGGHLPITMNLTSYLKCPITSIRLTVAVSNMLSSETIPSGQMIDESESVGRPYHKFQPDFDFFHFAGIMGDVTLFKLPAVYLKEAQLSSHDGWTLSVTLSDKLSPFYYHQVCFQIEGFRRVKCSDIELHKIKLVNRIVTHAESRALLIIVLNCGSRELPPMDNEIDGARCFGGEVHDMMRITDAPGSRMADLVDTQQLQGFGMHHEQLFSGRTMSLPAIMKDLYLLKQMGANVLRTSHYPYSRAYLDACDELGLSVIAECPAVGLKSFSEKKLLLHKQILKEMMVRDHLHPSIIMWSIANEPESQQPEAREYFMKLTEFARTELKRFTVDAKRPLTAAIAQSHQDDKIGEFLDVIMVNRYYGWYDCTSLVDCVRPSLLKSLSGWAEKHPGKPLMLSEFGADTLAGLHSSTSELFSEEYQRDLLMEYERVFDELYQNGTSMKRDRMGFSHHDAASNATLTGKERINFLGSMIWNFADFSTHESLLRVGGNKKGVFTRWREPKLAAESIKRVYRSRARQ